MAVNVPRSDTVQVIRINRCHFNVEIKIRNRIKGPIIYLGDTMFLKPNQAKKANDLVEILNKNEAVNTREDG